MQDTKQIRKKLKEELGYNARQVSVSGGRGNITFTIRDEKVDEGSRFPGHCAIFVGILIQLGR